MPKPKINLQIIKFCHIFKFWVVFTVLSFLGNLVGLKMFKNITELHKIFTVPNFMN